MADVSHNELFEEVAACSQDIVALQQQNELLERKMGVLDKNLFMTLRGIMVLLEDLSFATMSLDGLPADRRLKVDEEQRIARQRVHDTLNALKKAIG